MSRVQSVLSLIIKIFHLLHTMHDKIIIILWQIEMIGVREAHYKIDLNKIK